MPDEPIPLRLYANDSPVGSKELVPTLNRRWFTDAALPGHLRTPGAIYAIRVSATLHGARDDRAPDQNRSPGDVQ